MTDTSTSIDQKEIQRLADEAAAAKFKELQDQMIQRIGGQTEDRNTPPENWGAVARTEDIQRIEKRAEEIARKTIEDERKRQEEERTKTYEEQKKQADQEYAQVVSEWKEAVADGLLPPINPAIDKKIQSGATYDQLTPEEQQDPGLQAFNDTFKLHAQLKREGKSSSFYRTTAQFLNKQPAGAYAPVFGSSVSSQQPQEDDYTYEEIHHAAKRAGKFRQ